eukprot:3187400-Alexandrium_andersonii.AAC.1
MSASLVGSEMCIRDSACRDDGFAIVIGTAGDLQAQGSASAASAWSKYGAPELHVQALPAFKKSK